MVQKSSFHYLDHSVTSRQNNGGSCFRVTNMSNTQHGKTTKKERIGENVKILANWRKYWRELYNYWREAIGTTTKHAQAKWSLKMVVYIYINIYITTRLTNASISWFIQNGESCKTER